MTARVMPEASWTIQREGGDLVVGFCAHTEVGLVRTINEDAILASPPVFLVADGMGGHARGDAASRAVVEAFSALEGRKALAVDDITAALDAARGAVLQIAGEDGSAPGSTVVAATFIVDEGRDYWLIMHVGDSRAYRVRAGSLERLTRDHSVVQELIDSGEIGVDDARQHPERHVVTRAIGADVESPPEFALIPVETGDRLVLCSDGLCGDVDDAEISSVVASGGTSSRVVEQLVDLALAGGGNDNISVIVIDVSGAVVGEQTLGNNSDATGDTVRSNRRAS